ncbi:MAG: hypothetical protein M3O22_00245 [Pseudomonadota bacterium]|nr:hypothetical protein [Pseudomonadota bacterium]
MKNPAPEEVRALEGATAPGTKQGIHRALEILGQIKPVGKSDVKQSTVIAYLVFDLVDEGVSEFVVNEVCREYRRDPESPFFPNGAEFLKKACQAMKKYQAALSVASGEGTPPGKKTSSVPEPDYPVGEERRRLADGFAQLGNIIRGNGEVA